MRLKTKLRNSGCKHEVKTAHDVQSIVSIVCLAWRSVVEHSTWTLSRTVRGREKDESDRLVSVNGILYQSKGSGGRRLTLCFRYLYLTRWTGTHFCWVGRDSCLATASDYRLVHGWRTEFLWEKRGAYDSAVLSSCFCQENHRQVWWLWAEVIGWLQKATEQTHGG